VENGKLLFQPSRCRQFCNSNFGCFELEGIAISAFLGQRLLVENFFALKLKEFESSVTQVVDITYHQLDDICNVKNLIHRTLQLFSLQNFEFNPISDCIQRQT
jgi:hypothetical protein